MKYAHFIEFKVVIETEFFQTEIDVHFQEGSFISSSNGRYKSVFSFGFHPNEVFIGLLCTSINMGSNVTPNTVAYYKLDSVNTTNDLSGNGYNLTIKGNATFGTYGGVDCCYINVGQLYTSGIQAISGDGPFTLSIFYYEVSAPNNDNGALFTLTNQTPSSFGYFNGIVRNNGWSGYGGGRGIVGLIDNAPPNYYTSPTYSISSGHWIHVVYVYSGTSQKIYINGSLYSSGTAGSNRPSNYTDLVISRNSSIDRSIKGYVSEAIAEKKARSVEEITEYYNKMKSKYGM